jgi:alpha-ribazole phosphatase/probable phosphoglycerate mutase
MAHEILVLRAGHVTDDSRSPGGHRSIEIVYETHSVSVDNERGVATGWLDGELSETGRELALELGARRRDDGIAVVYSSDLGRAVETAEIAFGGSGIPVRLDRRLRECNYGELNGMPSARLREEVPRRIDTPYPGGESYRQVVERVRDFLVELPSELDGERIVLISHAAPRWSLQHLLGGERLEDLVAAPFDWRPGWEFVLGR